MKRIIISVISLLLLCTVSAQIRRQITPAQRQVRTSNSQILAVERPAVARIPDTIPGHMYKYYTIDKKRYLHYLSSNLNDSVKLLKAVAKDWEDFEAASSKLQQTLKNNPYSNVSNYISPDKDFKSIELVNKKFQSNTAKVCLRQLIFNIKLSDVLLNKPLTDQTDLQLLTMSITNIDTLCLAYIVPFVTRTMSLMKNPKIIFKVFDKDGRELSKAGCYLVSPYVCRSLACLSCKNIVTPCASQTMDKIIGQKDYLFDCANPAPIEIAQGPYHIFIVNNGAIVSYKSWSADANDLTPDLQPKIINLHLQ